MGLVVIGLSHKTAPVEIREHLAMPSDRLVSALADLQNKKELKEAVILSTCNRFEIYARPEMNRQEALISLATFFRDLYKKPGLEKLLYKWEAQHAVRHLFRVASGLDSMVVGEGEVLGQVKSAYLMAQQQGATGKITNVLFQRALFVGKHVRSNTNISKGASSVGSLAVHLAERIFGSLHNHQILLLGAGKIAEVTARHLLSQKAGDIVVLNRTTSKAEELASLFKGRAGSLDDLKKELTHADIVLCSASVEKPLITRDFVEAILKERRGRSLYFVDIAVPRNVDPRVHDLDNVYVYNIDDLKNIVDESMSRRHKDVEEAETIVEHLSQEFYNWISAVLEGKSISLSHGDLKFPRPS